MSWPSEVKTVAHELKVGGFGNFSVGVGTWTEYQGWPPMLVWVAVTQIGATLGGPTTIKRYGYDEAQAIEACLRAAAEQALVELQEVAR